MNYKDRYVLRTYILVDKTINKDVSIQLIRDISYVLEGTVIYLYNESNLACTTKLIDEIILYIKSLPTADFSEQNSAARLEKSESYNLVTHDDETFNKYALKNIGPYIYLSDKPYFCKTNSYNRFDLISKDNYLLKLKILNERKEKIINKFENLCSYVNLVCNENYETIHLFINTKYCMNLHFKENINYTIYEIIDNQIYHIFTTCDILSLYEIRGFYKRYLEFYFLETYYPTISELDTYDEDYNLVKQYCKNNKDINKALYVRDVFTHRVLFI